MKNALSKDPLGHIKLSVSYFKRSKEFYTKLFNSLGFQKISDKEKSAGWRTPEGFGIYIAQAESPKLKHGFSVSGLHHLCVKAGSRSEVDKVYKMLKEDTFIFDPPKDYPKYTGKYYAVFFSDPDGLKVEVAYY